MQAYLKLDHIDKSFTRGNATTEVLKEINLTINKGEYVSIIGHSGCGKSTLLNIVAGLTGCTTGCVLLENREVNSPGPDRAVVFQNHSLLPWLTVYENVKLGVDKVFSSSKSTFGSMASARAIPTRCFMPPEISDGRLSLAWAICTRLRLCITQAPRSARVLVEANTLSTPSLTFS